MRLLIVIPNDLKWGFEAYFESLHVGGGNLNFRLKITPKTVCLSILLTP